MHPSSSEFPLRGNGLRPPLFAGFFVDGYVPFVVREFKPLERHTNESSGNIAKSGAMNKE